LIRICAVPRIVDLDVGGVVVVDLDGDGDVS
jgi:hypothetical protein